MNTNLSLLEHDLQKLKKHATPLPNPPLNFYNDNLLRTYYIRTLMDNPAKLGSPLDSSLINVGDLSQFYLKNIPSKGIHDAMADTLYGQLYYLNSDNNGHRGLYFLGNSAFPDSHRYLISGAYVVDLQDDDANVNNTSVWGGVRGVRGVKTGDTVYVVNDPNVLNRGTYVALKDAKDNEFLPNDVRNWRFLPSSTINDIAYYTGTVDKTFDPGTVKAGYFYITKESGTYTHFEDADGVSIDADKDDQLFHNGEAWQLLSGDERVNFTPPVGFTGVASVFTRGGDVVALADDYDIPKITGLQTALDEKTTEAWVEGRTINGGTFNP